MTGDITLIKAGATKIVYTRNGKVENYVIAHICHWEKKNDVWLIITLPSESINLNFDNEEDRDEAENIIAAQFA